LDCGAGVGLAAVVGSLGGSFLGGPAAFGPAFAAGGDAEVAAGGTGFVSAFGAG